MRGSTRLPWVAGLAMGTLLFAAEPIGAESGEQPAVTIGVDSRAFGTFYSRCDTGGRGTEGWTWGTGAQFSLPLLLAAKGGGLDTVALEVEGRAEWDSPDGWFARGRLTTGLSSQNQVLGSFTAWTGGLSLEPGYRGSWGEIWFLARPQVTFLTLVRPSVAMAATFDERYQEGPSGSTPDSIVLGMSAVRLLGGVGVRLTVTKTVTWGFTLGVYPTFRSHWLSWTDGFSFGEIPFFASVDCRIRL